MCQALLNSKLFLTCLQKQDDDEGKSRTAAGREFEAAGPQTFREAAL